MDDVVCRGVVWREMKTVQAEKTMKRYDEGR